MNSIIKHNDCIDINAELALQQNNKPLQENKHRITKSVRPFFKKHLGGLIRFAGVSDFNPNLTIA